MSGGKNFTLFKALNASARNCRAILSLKRKFLNNERSVFHHAGAEMMSRPDVPNLSGKVCEKTLGLNQYRLVFVSPNPSRGVIPLNEE